MASHDYRAHPSADSLVSWFTKNGGWVSPDVQIVYSDSHGFHMRTVRPLTSSNVVSCPLSLSLSYLNLDPNQKEVLTVDSDLSRCKGAIADHILTYLLLIEQRTKGEASPWHAYIACLPGPESMTTPIWFEDNDMAFLSGTALAPAARERKAEMLKHLEHATEVLKEHNVALANHIDIESLSWAATIFTSRAFISTHILPGQETTPILFPVIDILNHSVSAKVEWDFQPHKSFTLKCLEGSGYGPGQELFNNYAPKQNDELLLGYGFCLEDNPIEQFALKLAFPQMLQEYALETGLLDPSNVPFGMPSSFLEADPNKEQHFLRAKGHPFGRYQNKIPIFRGIPPYVVHFFFIQTIMKLGLDIGSLDAELPGPRVILQVLALLHHALEQRCLSLPLHNDDPPRNDKQKYAKMYRDGQAKIIHAVREELKSAMNQIRVPSGELPPLRTTLFSVDDCLDILKVDFPTEASQFHTTMTRHFHAAMTGQDDPPPANIFECMLLVTLIGLRLTSRMADNTLLASWIRDFIATHPLPALEDGIEDILTYTFIDEHIGEFFSLANAEDGLSPIEVLDDLGETFVNQPVGSGEKVFVQGKTENLGVRVIMWAMTVVEQRVLTVYGEAGEETCLFVQPVGLDGRREDDAWMIEQV